MKLPRPVLTALLVTALLLPVVQTVLYGVGKLLTAMQDVVGARFIDRLILVCATLWVISLVALVVLLAMQSLGSLDDRSGD